MMIDALILDDHFINISVNFSIKSYPLNMFSVSVILELSSSK